NDGTADSNTATVSITVSAVNDAPVLVAPGSAFTLALDTPNGTTVGAPLTATDVDGDAVTFALTADTSGGGFEIDPATGQLSVRDAGALRGIAVTGVDIVNGTWEYNTTFPAGTWKPIVGVSSASALLLAADADTRVRFHPNPGSKPAYLGLSFKAWDGADGAGE